MLGKDLNKEEVACFVDLIDILSSTDVKFVIPKKLAEGIGKTMNRFISDEGFCERCTNVILSSMDETEGKTQDKN